MLDRSVLERPNRYVASLIGVSCDLLDENAPALTASGLGMAHPPANCGSYSIRDNRHTRCFPSQSRNVSKCSLKYSDATLNTCRPV